jgi:hypothetical protein
MTRVKKYQCSTQRYKAGQNFMDMGKQNLR